MRLVLCLSLLALASAPLAGCSSAGAVDPCDQFAPATGKAPKSCPAKPVADKPYKPAKYCYSSLGQADCFAEPQPGRPGYLGAGD